MPSVRPATPEPTDQVRPRILPRTLSAQHRGPAPERRLSLVVVEGRRQASAIFDAAVRSEGTFESAAAAIGRSPRLVRRWADADDQVGPQLGDVLAMHAGGHQQLAVAILRQCLAFLEERTVRRGWEPHEHAMSLAAAAGAFAIAVQEGSTREQRVAALRHLERRALEALRDEAGDEGER